MVAHKIPAVTKAARRRKARALRRSQQFDVNRVRLLHDGAQAFPAMRELIERAEREILLEMYWFVSDGTGRRFAEALARRAREGLDVRITYDAVGSFEASARMFDELRAAGCRVHEFHPVAPWRKDFSLGRIGRRDHRKVLVVDGRVGITGGINFGDPWASLEDGGGNFRDDAIEVEGTAAWELRQVFFRTRPDRPAPLPRPAPPPEGRGCKVTVLAGDHAPERRSIRQGYLDAIQMAREDIVICNSYFIPDLPTRSALFDARERGVRVRVLMPGRSDVAAVQLASRALYSRLLRRGIELFEWNHGVLHSKTAVVDDQWCTVGSFNFDARSLHNNLEINLAVEHRATARALRERIEHDIAESVRIEPDAFKRRPWVDKLAEQLCYGLRWGL